MFKTLTGFIFGSRVAFELPTITKATDEELMNNIISLKQRQVLAEMRISRDIWDDKVADLMKEINEAESQEECESMIYLNNSINLSK